MNRTGVRTPGLGLWVMPIVGGLVVGAMLGALIGLVRPASYSASATGLVVATGQPSGVAEANAGQELAIARSQTYAALGGSLMVAQTTSQKLSGHPSPEDLLGKVQVDSGAVVPTLTVAARAETPEEARDLANAWMESLDEVAGGIGGGGAKGQLVDVTVITKATTPDAADQPTTPVLVLILSLLGMISAVVGRLIWGHGTAPGSRGSVSRQQDPDPVNR